MIILDNVTVADQFPNENATQPSAIMFPAVKSSGGYFTILNNPVYVELAYNIESADYGHGQSRWTKAIPFPTGPGILLPGTVGIRFRNYTPGSAAIVSGALAEHAEPSIAVTSSGAFTSSAAAVIVPNTVLPGSPSDGQQAILWDSGVAPTYQWLLQWNAALGRWIFLGGEPAYVFNDGSVSSTGGNNVFQTVTPSFQVPRQGIYLCQYGANGTGNASASTSYIGISANGSAPNTGDRSTMNSSNSTNAPAIETFQTPSIPALSTITLQIADGDSTRRIAFIKRWLTVVPFQLQ